MSRAKKIVLVSSSAYESRYEPLLISLVERRIHLFRAVGVGCEQWEDAMDWACVGPRGEGDWFVTTSSHPDETIAEAVEFARNWALDEPSAVEILEV